MEAMKTIYSLKNYKSLASVVHIHNCVIDTKLRIITIYNKDYVWYRYESASLM